MKGERSIIMTKIILFGDSITAGYADGEINPILTEAVKAEFSQFEVINAGIPGDTTVDGLKRLGNHVTTYQPEVVTVFFGANDVALHNQVSLADYQINLRKIIEAIGPEKVILLTTPFASQRNQSLDRPLEAIESYTIAALELATELQLPVINLLEVMLASPEPENYLQADGLHFSAAGYDMLSREINQAIKKLIKRKSDSHE